MNSLVTTKNEKPHIVIEIFSITLTVIAIFGNTISIYIFTRSKFLKESIFRYFLVSEIICSISLIFLWMIKLQQIPTDLFCKLIIWFLYSAYDYIPWISVLNSVDLLLTSKYPFNFKSIKKFKCQAIMLSTILVVVIVINIPRYLFDIKTENNLCDIQSKSIGFTIYLVDLIISTIIPFSITFLCSFTIIKFLSTQNAALTVYNIRKQNKQKDLTRSVLGMYLWFFFTHSPFSIINLLYFIFDFKFTDENVWGILGIISYFLVCTRTCCNFFGYLCFNRLFRDYFLSIFKTCKKNRVGVLQTTTIVAE
jgi:hypothetical protein